ncbi:MAG: hypothetical protein FJW26_09305 [Acidimicrobiia bacterium]|nr:hypothetical protein [Acidimicrobiia bacterium]
MIHIKDILRSLVAQDEALSAQPRELPLVPATMTLDRLLDVMQQARTQMVVVMDEHGGTAGLLTIEDLFEEVIGEVDEKPVRHSEMDHDASGTLRVAGTVRIEELGERLNHVLEHEEVDTVSGLILTILGRPPVVGDVVLYDGVQFQVTEVASRGVEQCQVALTEKRRTLARPER